MKVILRLRPPLTRGPGGRLFLSASLIASGLLAAAGGAYYLIAVTYAKSAPQRAETQYRLGMSLAKPGTYQEAAVRFSDAIRIRPEFPEAYLQRGIAHQALGEADAALADFDRAVALEPKLAEAHSARGGLLRDKGNVQLAIEAFTASIKIQPTLDAYFQRGQTYESLGQHQKAIDDYDQAIDLMSNAPYIYRARALAKSRLGDVEGAEADRASAGARDHSGR